MELVRIQFNVRKNIKKYENPYESGVHITGSNRLIKGRRRKKVRVSRETLLDSFHARHGTVLSRCLAADTTHHGAKKKPAVAVLVMNFSQVQVTS